MRILASRTRNPEGLNASGRDTQLFQLRRNPVQVGTIGVSKFVEVRVDSGIVWCGWDGVPCRRVLVAASPGDPVELEVVPHDSSNHMALGVARIPEDSFVLEPDMSVRRLMVPPGGIPYVIGAGTARRTARR